MSLYSNFRDVLAWVLQICCPQTPTPTNDLFRTKPQMAEEWKEALARCHKYHGFFFLDLPRHVRMSIYEHLFDDGNLTVCSFNKDHTAEEFAETEICQILLTCRTIFDEAQNMMYQKTNFIIPKISSLDYFTWNEEDQEKVARVRTVTLAKPDVIIAFCEKAYLFEALQLLIIDTSMILKLPGRMLEQHHSSTVRSIRRSNWWARSVGCLIPPAQNRHWCVALVVHVLHNADTDIEEQEICLVEIDTLTIVRNYLPVPEAEEEHVLEMPSAQDPDAMPMVSQAPRRPALRLNPQTGAADFQH